MKISKRGEYAMRALIDLGIAREAGRELLQAHEIAAKENIPIRFLEQIMITLRGAGIIATRRGKEGGYYLNRPSDAISMGAVVRLIDGPLAPIRCVSQTAYERCSCPDEEHCGLRMLMLDVRNAIARILDQYTLADVVEVTLRKLKRNNMAIPFQSEGSSLPHEIFGGLVDDEEDIAEGGEVAAATGTAPEPNFTGKPRKSRVSKKA